jgi:hypothetical protein
MELVSIKKSTDGKHKYEATFKNTKTNRTKTTKFGAVGYDDYTTLPKDTRDENQKSYKARHKGDNLTDPTSAGALSWWVLWSSPTVKGGIANYKKHFKL